jgi:translation initiation factor IF-2
MTENELDGYGPVDFLIVEFPAGESNFTGEIAEEIVRLVDAGTIRVIDMIVIAKDADGNLDAVEISDAEDLGPLTAIEAGLAGLLAEEDVAYLAAAMEPGSVAGVLVYENLWAAPFAAAARRAGGVLIADGRISPEDVVAAFAAIAELEEELEEEEIEQEIEAEITAELAEEGR